MRKFTLYLVGFLLFGTTLSQFAQPGSSGQGESVKISEENLAEQLKVFPNPNDGRFQLSLDYEGKETISVKIYDITGKVLKEISDDLILDESSVKANVELESPRAGIYILKMVIGTKMITKKIIVR